MEAGEILFQNNPMSAICSVVCNHEQQCAGYCIRGKKDTPVHFSSIENYISDMYLDRMEIEKPEPKGKKVTVISTSLWAKSNSNILAEAFAKGAKEEVAFTMNPSLRIRQEA